MKRFWITFIVAILIFGLIFGVYSKDFLAETTSGKPTDIVAEPINEIDEEEIPEIEEAKTTNISLLAVGDIMFHSPQFIAAKNPDNSYDFNSVFKYVQDYIQEADLAIGNLETVTAGKERGYSGFPRFNSPKEVLEAIKNAGFDILSTANNHSLDQGKTGIISTIEAINEYGLKNIGTYKDENKEILLEDIEGIRIGFLSYTYGVNGLESLLSSTDLNNMINRIDEEKIKTDIKSVKEIGADIIVVYIHWGYEYHREPSTYQIELSQKMVEWGANIILGTHPHVIQRAEIIKHNGQDNFVIYSMGNFLSNQRYKTMGDPFTEDGIMVKIILEKNLLSKDVIIKDVIYIPTWVYRYKENNKLNYHILPLDNMENIDLLLPDDILTRMEKSYKDTMRTINPLEYSE